jgi:hypothetical protein
MINIENYMHDGANWQAQAVLAYLRATKSDTINETWNKEYHCYDAEVYVGRYENCREQGYIFSVRYNGKQRNYCVYEHRNSDQICVVVFDALTTDTPQKELVWNAMGDNKWNFTKSFGFGEIVSCGDYIVEDIKEFINKVKVTNKK